MCPSCRSILFKAELEANQQVCPKCGHHFRIGARTRIENLLEPGYELVDLELRSTDPLDFTDLKRYKKRLADAQKKTGLNDAIINAIGQKPTYRLFREMGAEHIDLQIRGVQAGFHLGGLRLLAHELIVAEVAQARGPACRTENHR